MLRARPVRTKISDASIRSAQRADPDARDKALRTYEALLAVDPANIEGLYQSAFLHALAGKFAESRGLVARLPAEIRDRPQTLAVLVADLAGIADATAPTTCGELIAHPELTAADVLAVLPAFDHIKDDAVPRLLLEGARSPWNGHA